MNEVSVHRAIIVDYYINAYIRYFTLALTLRPHGLFLCRLDFGVSACGGSFFLFSVLISPSRRLRVESRCSFCSWIIVSCPCTSLRVTLMDWSTDNTCWLGCGSGDINLLLRKNELPLEGLRYLNEGRWVLMGVFKHSVLTVLEYSQRFENLQLRPLLAPLASSPAFFKLNHMNVTWHFG